KNLYLNFICSKQLLCLLLIVCSIFMVFMYLTSIPVGFPRTNTQMYEYHSYFSMSLIPILFIFLAVITFLITLRGTQNSFNLSLSFGSTRKDYFYGSMFFYTLLAAVFSISLTILFLVEKLILNSFGINQLLGYSFLSKKVDLINLLRMNIYVFVTLLAGATLIYMLSFLVYKVGRVLWAIIIFGIVTIYMRVYPYNFLDRIINPSKINVIIYLIIIFVSYLISYFVMMKTELRN
ncbi:MAG TPA: hypothetical protein VIK72_01035, partial [Clostridiaceae bacterium]